MELDDDQKRLAKHVCTFVDRTGYIGTREKASADGPESFRNITLDEIAALYDEPVTVEDVEDTLVHVVQKLDPAGVGARDAKECLLLQITPETPYADVLRVIIRDHLDDVAHNRIPVIHKATRFDIPTIQDAIEALRHNLAAAPGLKYAETETHYIVPDIIVERTDANDYEARLVDDWIPTIRISKRYVEMCKNKDLPDTVREEMRKKLQSADWLVKAVEQRRNTLLKVTRAIIDHQRAFLDAGPEHIQPLKMQQIADQVKVHVTTVSRAVGRQVGADAPRRVPAKTLLRRWPDEQPDAGRSGLRGDEAEVDGAGRERGQVESAVGRGTGPPLERGRLPRRPPHRDEVPQDAESPVEPAAEGLDEGVTDRRSGRCKGIPLTVSI